MRTYYTEAREWIKPINEDDIIDFNLADFMSDEYKNYKHSKRDVHEIVSHLLEQLKQIESIVKDMSAQANDAGSFLAPGIRDAIKADLKNIAVYIK